MRQVGHGKASFHPVTFVFLINNCHLKNEKKHKGKVTQNGQNFIYLKFELFVKDFIFIFKKLLLKMVAKYTFPRKKKAVHG